MVPKGKNKDSFMRLTRGEIKLNSLIVQYVGPEGKIEILFETSERGDKLKSLTVSSTELFCPKGK